MPPLFTMLTIKNLTKSHAGRTLFRETEMTINWGERVALVGPNGAGKSTLFRMILGEDTPDEGSINMDEYAMVGYLPQEASEPKDETVLEIAMGITPEMERAIHVIRTAENANKTDTPEYAEAIDTFNAANGYQLEPKAKKILKGLAFRESDFHRPAREMSGGWIMRAYLAKLLVLEPDLLMLDEPTNHLDIASREWIEEAVEAFDGTLLFVSHDRYFINRFATRVWELAEGTINDYPMGFAQYRAVKAEEKKPAPAPVQKKKQDTRPPRAGREKQAARRQLTICETGISRLEERCRQLDAEMEQNACNVEKLQELYREKQEVEAQLEQEMARWEELSLQLEE